MDASERRRRAGEEATHWWLRLQHDDLGRDQREQFIDWLRESAVHVAEMLRVAQVHGALEQFERWTSIATQGSRNESDVVSLSTRLQSAGPPAIPRRRRKAWLGSLAAGVAVVVVCAAVLLPKFRGQVIDTDRGERREVVLSDGSVVQVDPQTRLRVKFSEGSRDIVLERGRALFRVARHPQRPFLVEAGETVVRAVGTVFGVERLTQKVVVTVAEGRVAVTRAEPPGSFEKAGGAAVSLDAGQQATVERTGSDASVLKVDSSRELAWATGRLVFENETVAGAVAQFNRYNRVQLSVTDATLAARPISGIFDAADPESFIAFLQSDADLRIEREADEAIRISPRP